MTFTGQHGKDVDCKMSCIPIRLCEFPEKDLTLVAVYGFGAEPMLLLSNLKIQERKRLCQIITQVYLMRWRIEEYVDQLIADFFILNGTARIDLFEYIKIMTSSHSDPIRRDILDNME